MHNTFITGFCDDGDNGRFDLSFFGLSYKESWIQSNEVEWNNSHQRRLSALLLVFARV